MYACLHAPSLEEESGGLLVNCAYGFSPQVEETDARTVVLAIDGVERLLGPPERMARAMARRAAELGMEVRVAVAANPDAAVHAARGFAGITILRDGAELAGLPIELLGAPPEIEETLRSWGMRCFRDLAALPEAGLAERLGPEGIRLRKLARGEWERALDPSTPETGFKERLELEHPVAMLEPLQFLLARLLEDLLRRLEASGLATNELRLKLQLEDESEHARVLRLPFPMRSRKTFLKLLQLDLEGHPPQAPVVAVELGAAAADPRVVQYGLFLPPTPEPEKLELTLGRIGKLVGVEHVGAAELVDSHRPGAFRMKRFAVEGSAPLRAQRAPRLRTSVLRVFRPPLRAMVEAPEGRPRRIAARGVRGTVEMLAGPWRSSGEWWRPDGWSREEWDVALSDGALYRIYQDQPGGVWFVEGVFD